MPMKNIYTLVYSYSNTNEEENYLLDLSAEFKEEEELIDKLLEKIEFTPRKEIVDKILNYAKKGKM